MFGKRHVERNDDPRQRNRPSHCDADASHARMHAAPHANQRQAKHRAPSKQDRRIEEGIAVDDHRVERQLHRSKRLPKHAWQQRAHRRQLHQQRTTVTAARIFASATEQVHGSLT